MALGDIKVLRDNGSGSYDEVLAATYLSLRNKRVVTNTDDATAVIDIDNTDIYELSAISNNTEFTITGTPVNGQGLIIRLKDAGVSKSLTWSFTYAAIGLTIPTATTTNKWHYLGFQYNTADSKWHFISYTVQV